MNEKLLLIAAALMAVGGVVMLFTIESKAVGLLFIVTALLFTVSRMNARKK